MTLMAILLSEATALILFCSVLTMLDGLLLCEFTEEEEGGGTLSLGWLIQTINRGVRMYKSCWSLGRGEEEEGWWSWFKQLLVQLRQVFSSGWSLSAALQDWGVVDGGRETVCAWASCEREEEGETPIPTHVEQGTLGDDTLYETEIKFLFLFL